MSDQTDKEIDDLKASLEGLEKQIAAAEEDRDERKAQLDYAVEQLVILRNRQKRCQIGLNAMTRKWGRPRKVKDENVEAVAAAAE